MQHTPKPAMTMREIREGLGHPVPPPGVPEPDVLPTAYVVSCLPLGHEDRLTYTINVVHRGDSLYAVKRNLRFADANGAWEYEPGWPEDGSEADTLAEEKWLEAHRFDHDTALRLAKQLAPTLTYRGRTVADVLAAERGCPGFEKQYQGESDAKRRLARCKHCSQPRTAHTAPAVAVSGGEK